MVSICPSETCSQCRKQNNGQRSSSLGEKQPRLKRSRILPGFYLPLWDVLAVPQTEQRPEEFFSGREAASSEEVQDPSWFLFAPVRRTRSAANGTTAKEISLSREKERTSWPLRGAQASSAGASSSACRGHVDAASATYRPCDSDHAW